MSTYEQPVINAESESVFIKALEKEGYSGWMIDAMFTENNALKKNEESHLHEFTEEDRDLSGKIQNEWRGIYSASIPRLLERLNRNSSILESGLESTSIKSYLGEVEIGETKVQRVLGKTSHILEKVRVIKSGKVEGGWTLECANPEKSTILLSKVMGEKGMKTSVVSAAEFLEGQIKILQKDIDAQNNGQKTGFETAFLEKQKKQLEEQLKKILRMNAETEVSAI